MTSRERLRRSGHASRRGLDSAEGHDQAQGICFHFQRGKCTYGSTCRFSHDSTVANTPQWSFDNGSPFTGTPAQRQYVEWKTLLRKYRYGDIRVVGQEFQLWEGALAILDGSDQEHHQLLAKDLGDQELGGHELISTMRTILSDVLAHLPTAEAFLKAITHPSLLDCLSIDPYVEALYGFLGGADGRRAIAFLMHICRQVADGCRRRVKFRLPIPSIARLLVKALHELLNRDQRIRLHDALSALFSLLDEILLLTIGGWPRSDAYALKTRIDLMKRQAVAAKERLAIAKEHNEKPGRVGLHLSFPTQLEPPGGRHDNDLADITQIEIIPTLEEIICDCSEYLPSTNFLLPHVLENPVERYLDSHFRLLRHDVIGAAKDVLRHLLQQDDLRLNPYLPSDTRAHLYLRSSIRQIFMNQNSELEALVSFSTPPQLRDRPPAEQRRWWQESSQLEEGSLICFLSSQRDERRLVFLEVTVKNTTNGKEGENMSNLVSQNSPPSITVKLARWMQDDLTLLARFYMERTEGVLVGFHSLIPATFVPILKNLQRMQRNGELVFQQWILPSCGAISPHRGTHIPPPAYARKPGFTFPLEPISKSGDRQPNLHPVAAPDTMDTSELQILTGLDPGQCRGLIAALTREYALIQGPPGTGKSYLGVQVVRTLLAVKGQAGLGPILVVCYTNHALDQFLKHLLDVGIGAIIRMGSGSQAPELAGKNLRVLSRDISRTKVESQILGKTYSSLDDCVKEAGRNMEPLRQSRQGLSWAVLQSWLCREKPRLYEQFEPQISDRFTATGQDPLTSWLGGRPSNVNGHADDLSADVQDIEDLEYWAEQDIYSLTSEERWTLVGDWVDQSFNDQAALLFESIDRAEHLRRTKDGIHDEINRRTLMQADVIGMTTTSLARNSELLRRVRPKVIICEEAAEVMEAHIISALMPGVEHLIQIGDHKQLRPQISNHSLSLEMRSGLAWQLDRSQFERRAVGEPGLPPVPIAQLNVQRRMMPEISQLIRKVYPNLQDHESVFHLPDVVGMRHNLFWLDHRYAESTKDTGTRVESHSNQWEVEMATALARHLVRQGQYKSSDIALLTPYAGQLRLLKAALAENFEVFLNERDLNTLASEGIDNDLEQTRAETRMQVEQKQPLQTLRLATVDNFQGEEAKVVVVSLVRSNADRNVGFLRTENRINVLLSRAQHGMYLIGNTQTYLSVPMWADVYSSLAREGGVGTALTLCCARHPNVPIRCSQPADFQHKSPEGGCSLPCTRRLKRCGHRCQARCHSTLKHDVFTCRFPCPRIRATCNHVCPKLCGETCGPCMVKVGNLKFPCGHVKNGVLCHETLELANIQCRVQASCFRGVS